MRKNPATGGKASGKRHTVAVVIADGMAPFEFAVACEVFGIDRSEELGVPWYRFVVCAVNGHSATTVQGFTITTPNGLDVLRRADTIVVPVPHQLSPGGDALIDAIRTAHRRGARLLSICTGAFTLAEAGLLDGRRATTHWLHAAELAARYPAVDVDPDVLYIDEGDVLTSAGTAAGIDLCLHVVRNDFGAQVANEVARRMVVPPHRDGGQAQFVCEPVPSLPGTDLFMNTLSWVQEHLDQPLTIDDLARRAAMSPRTFARRFRDATGTTPHQWLLRQRVMLAQRLLETSDLPVEAIADHAGLGSPANLRQHFHRVLHTSPATYRRTFRSTVG